MKQEKLELIRAMIDPDAAILPRPGNPNGDCVILMDGKVIYYESVSGYHIFRTNLPMNVVSFEKHHNTEGKLSGRLLDGDVQDDTVWGDWVHKKVRFCELQYDRIMARYLTRTEELNDFKRKILSMARFGVWFVGHPDFTERGEIRVVRSHSETTINWSYNPELLTWKWDQKTNVEPSYLFKEEVFVPLYPATWDLLHAIGAIEITDNVDFAFRVLDAPDGFEVNEIIQQPKTNIDLNMLELMVETNTGNQSILFRFNRHLYDKFYGE